MAKVRQANTTPELMVRSVLHGLGYRFRLHRRELPGSPDIVLARHRTVVFVHGCFWHRHPGCKRSTRPKTNTEFWDHKFEENIERDRRNEEALRGLGWRVVVVWECETVEQALLATRLSVELSAGLAHAPWWPDDA